MKIKVMSKEAAQKLSHILKDGNWMVLYYSEYCGHCKDMKPEWNKFELDLPPNVNVAQVEAEQLKDLKYNPNIMGFPTIKAYKNNKEVAEFNNERTKENFEQFVRDNDLHKKSVKKLSKKIKKNKQKLEKLDAKQLKKDMALGRISSKNNLATIRKSLGQKDQKYNKKRTKIINKIHKSKKKLEQISGKNINNTNIIKKLSQIDNKNKQVEPLFRNHISEKQQKQLDKQLFNTINNQNDTNLARNNLVKKKKKKNKKKKQQQQNNLPGIIEEGTLAQLTKRKSKPQQQHPNRKKTKQKKHKKKNTPFFEYKPSK